MTRKDASSPEDALHAFAAEPNHDRALLERYLSNFPQLAGELVDLSLEMRRTVGRDEWSPDAADARLIDDAWRRFNEAAPSARVDPFAGMTAVEHAEIGGILGVPRMVLAAFQERRVRGDTVPRRFIERLAAALRVSSESVTFALAMPATPMASWEFDCEKPDPVDERLSFEELLERSGLSQDARTGLLQSR